MKGVVRQGAAGDQDPSFTPRVYAHMMPKAEGRARAAMDTALGSTAGQGGEET